MTAQRPQAIGAPEACSEPASPALQSVACVQALASAAAAGAWQHRAMQPGDLDAVMAVETSAYSHPWSRGNFTDSLFAGYLSELRLAADGQLLGYWVAMPGAQELHLLNITVTPGCQRQGHGRSLMQRLIGLARQRRDAQLWLEVRESNLGAQALYRSLGFEAVGLRRGYYPAPQGREHAVVMRLDSLVGPADMADVPPAEGRHALD